MQVIADQMPCFTSGTRYQYRAFVIALFGNGVGGTVLAGFTGEGELVDGFVGVAVWCRA